MNYKKLCGKLIAILRRTRNELRNANDFASTQADIAYEMECRKTRELRNQIRENEELKRDQEYKEWEDRQNLDRLEDARRYGNEYDVERIIDRMKRGC